MRGTKLFFKSDGYSFVLKGLNIGVGSISVERLKLDDYKVWETVK